jgi:hypothetical protein
MIRFHIRFHMPNASGLLVVIIKPKLNADFMQLPFCFLIFHERRVPKHMLYVL